MSIATLCTIAQSQKQLKYPSTGELGKQSMYTHTIEYYSVFKKKEILTHDKTFTNLEDICYQINWSQKYKYYMISLT